MFDPEDQDPLGYETSDLDRNFDPDPSPDQPDPPTTSAAPDPPSSATAILDRVEIDTLDPDRPKPATIPVLDKRARPPQFYLDTIPTLLDRRSINLIIGSSGSGRTTLYLTQLERYLTPSDHTFLGFPLGPSQQPEQPGILLGKGTLEALTKRIRALDLAIVSNPVRCPIRRWKAQNGENPLQTLYRLHEELSYAARQPVHFLVIESVQSLLEGSKLNDPSAVREFYDHLNEFCLERNVTILGTVGKAKMRRGEAFPQLGDSIYGSVAWAEDARTLIGIERTHLHLPEERRPQHRRIVIQAKYNDFERTCYMKFDESHRLQIVDYEAQQQMIDAPSHQQLDMLLDAAPPGLEWTKDDILAWGEGLGISKRTTEDWLSSRCDEYLGMLERVGSTRNRTYKKPSVN